MFVIQCSYNRLVLNDCRLNPPNSVEVWMGGMHCPAINFAHISNKWQCLHLMVSLEARYFGLILSTIRQVFLISWVQSCSISCPSIPYCSNAVTSDLLVLSSAKVSGIASVVERSCIIRRSYSVSGRGFADYFNGSPTCFDNSCPGASFNLQIQCWLSFVSHCHWWRENLLMRAITVAYRDGLSDHTQSPSCDH